VAAAKPIDVGAESSRTSQLDKQSQKGVSPQPSTSTAVSGPLNGCANIGYPAGGISSREFTHSRASSVDSDIYALSPSPAPSSPSSVYAAPVNYRNGSANTSTNARSNGKSKSNGHAAVNGSTSNSHAKGHHEDEIPIELSNTYNRTYGSQISTLSSPEMSLSTSPCETYDTRWGTKVNPNGTVNGTSSNGKARFDGLRNTQVHSYEQESGSQTQTQLMLHAVMQENDQLKSRMADMEGNYLRLARLNEAYRVELIGYRTRVSDFFASYSHVCLRRGILADLTFFKYLSLLRTRNS